MAFIRAAERYGVMPTIDRWVLANAFERIAEHMRRGDTLGTPCYAINLSGASLGEAALAPYICKKIDEHGIPPRLDLF